MNLSNLWDIVTGKPYRVQNTETGDILEFANFWQFLRCIRGKSGKPFIVYPAENRHGSENRPKPDLDTLRKSVAENPKDVRARHFLAAHLLTVGSLDEAYNEYLEVIAQLSSDQVSNADGLGPGQLGLAYYQMAKVLELMGRGSDARLYWQACADFWRAHFPDKKYLREIRYYTDAMEKLKSFQESDPHSPPTVHDPGA